MKEKPRFHGPLEKVSPERRIQAIQNRVAVVAIGASTLRGSMTGTIGSVRKHLAELQLNRFAIAEDFVIELDAATDELINSRNIDWRRAKAVKEATAVKSTSAWGRARKCLNIFLRDALYNFYLRERYSLHCVAKKLELPLDSRTALALHGRGLAGNWGGVDGLDKDESAKYQAHASSIASVMGVDRVDLDNFFWPNIASE